PELDRQGRPKMFYSQRIHDKCYRRPHFDAGQFVEDWDDEGARKGYCLYKLGCKGPTTYNACSAVRWNGGVSFPIQSGHGCLGCSEEAFWDQGSFYERLNRVTLFEVEKNADEIGFGAASIAAGAIGLHAALTAVRRAANRHENA
ncbi:MAG: hydrogenase small subunit, partial [Methylocystis sp.]|uniref:hydrogenase small subunit n=1 Tax=Methylocystis sp. TaxID=1911079 RepID=UPI003DA59B12